MNKSEELAKLLGLQPRKEEISNGVDFTGVYKDIYPDFNKPSNFVKLIELQISNKLIVGRYFQGSGQYRVPFSNQWYDRESFLNILIDCLKRTDKWCARNRNRIIKKIQQTEWEY